MQIKSLFELTKIAQIAKHAKQLKSTTMGTDKCHQFFTSGFLGKLLKLATRGAIQGQVANMDHQGRFHAKLLKSAVREGSSQM